MKLPSSEARKATAAAIADASPISALSSVSAPEAMFGLAEHRRIDRAVRRLDSATVVTISPDEWLLIGADEDAAALLAPYERQGGVVAVDVSGNRVAYALRGTDAQAVLARACAIDLSALASSSASATTVARTQAIVLCEDAESYRLLPRRSFAAYLECWFDAARS